MVVDFVVLGYFVGGGDGADVSRTRGRRGGRRGEVEDANDVIEVEESVVIV